MIKTYHKRTKKSTTWLIFSILGLLCCSCHTKFSASIINKYESSLLAKINNAREKNGAAALEISPHLSETAQVFAEHFLKDPKTNLGKNRINQMIAKGAFARFSLSHAVCDATYDKAEEKLINNPLSKGKFMHERLTHAGFGFSREFGKVCIGADLARLIPACDLEVETRNILDKIQKARTENSVLALKPDENLTSAAKDIVIGFMNDKNSSSDEFIQKAQKALNKKSFSLGRATITFQVVGKPEAVIIPSLTSDPALSYLGISIAQGNHAGHEPGSLVVALILAEPQGSNDQNSQIVDLPPPKSAPKKFKTSKNGSHADMAWSATLSGNHKKAAREFLREYKKNKNSLYIYEAARAFARNKDFKKALETMQKYEKMVEGEDREKAGKLVKKLENNESIFDESLKNVMSVEAKRFFLIGKRLLDDNEYDGAIDAFTQAYNFSKHPDIVYNIGLVYCRAGVMGKALAFFEEYQRNVKKVENVEGAKRFFYMGMELYKAGQFLVASKNFAMAYAFAPFPELIFNLALCYQMLGEKQKALKFFREFLDTSPDKKDKKQASMIISQIMSQSDTAD